MACRNDEPRPFPGKQPRRGVSNTGTCTRDDGNLILQHTHSNTSPRQSVGISLSMWRAGDFPFLAL